MRVTVIATGFDRRPIERPASVFAGAPRERERPPVLEPLDAGGGHGQQTIPPDALEIPSFLQED